MYRKVLFLLCVVVIPISLSFAAEEKVDPPWMEKIKDAPIFYDVPPVSSVRVEKNIVYDSQDQSAFDLYLPSKIQVKIPAIILIHGGPLPANLKTTPKEWAIYKSYGVLLANMGFAAVMLDHHFFGYDRLDQAQKDIDDVIAMVRSDAGKWNIDADRIIVWGFSGGGSFLCKFLKDPPPYIYAALSYYGVLDLNPLREEIPATVKAVALDRYSPARCIQGSKASLPILVVRGEAEDPTMIKGTDLFIKNAMDNHINLTLINYPGGHHAFDVVDKTPRTAQIIRQTMAFLLSLK